MADLFHSRVLRRLSERASGHSKGYAFCFSAVSDLNQIELPTVYDESDGVWNESDKNIVFDMGFRYVGFIKNVKNFRQNSQPENSMRYLYWGLLISLCQVAAAQNLKGGGEAYPDLTTNRHSLEDWRALRFGMFIHWGPVTLRGTEIGWSRGREVSAEEYDELYREFNPVLFNADEWIAIAKMAGMKYVVLVTKHHDGFTLWDSKDTNYDIMSGRFKRDVVREIADACRRQGLLFGTYYSILDWYHPDYPMQKNRTEWKTKHDMNRYVTFLRGQVQDLVQNYSSRILWFDGEWEEPWTHQMGMDLYAFVRNLDDAVLINNRVDKGRAGMAGTSASNQFAGDFATPEQRIGQYDLLTPWESCITLCEQWAWKPNDKLKSKDECIQTLVRTAGGDGNLLLNVAPMMDGRIESRQIERLRQIGDWLTVFGETIYGTRGGPVPPQSWGVTTQTGTHVFVHVLQSDNPVLVLPDFKAKVKSAKIFGTDVPIAFKRKDDQLILNLPKDAAEPIGQIIVLEK